MNLPKTFEAMEPQYNLRISRPDYDSTVVPSFIERSARTRETLAVRADIAYGDGAREKLDFFPGGKANAPLLVYFHGGFWQRGDKSMYSFLAEAFVARGVNVAVVNYDLCPTVRLSAIAPQTRRALAWLWKNAAELGFNREQIVVMGHSAGGHLTAMILATDWPTLDADLPSDLVKAGVPISGLFELDPIRYSSINDGLKMDAEEAERESPMNQLPQRPVPVLVVYGGSETQDFRRQSHIYAAALALRGWDVEQLAVPGCDHFDELNELARPDSLFFQKSLALIRRVCG